MVSIEIPARMSCDSDGCDKFTAVKLQLMAPGGFSFMPNAKDWQVGVGQLGRYITRCPEHKTNIVAPVLVGH